MGASYIGATSNSDHSATNLTTRTTTDLNVAANDLLVAYVKWEYASRTPTIVDEGTTNTFTRGTIQNTGGYTYGVFFWCLAASADSTARFTAQFGSATDYPTIIVKQFRPGDGYTFVLDPSSSNPTGSTGLSSTPSSGNITPVLSDVVVMAGLSEYAAWGSNTGYPRIGDTNTGVTNYKEHDQSSAICYTESWHKIFTSAPGTIDADSSMSTSGDWVCQIAAFGQSSGAGASAVPVFMYHYMNH